MDLATTGAADTLLGDRREEKKEASMRRNRSISIGTLTTSQPHNLATRQGPTVDPEKKSPLVLSSLLALSVLCSCQLDSETPELAARSEATLESCEFKDFLPSEIVCSATSNRDYVLSASALVPEGGSCDADSACEAWANSYGVPATSSYSKTLSVCFAETKLHYADSQCANPVVCDYAEFLPSAVTCSSLENGEYALAAAALVPDDTSCDVIPACEAWANSYGVPATGSYDEALGICFGETNQHYSDSGCSQPI